MGTDWNIFESVDHRVENVIEIYQGARVSYEGRNAPQPTVGLREGERYNAAATLAGDPLPGEPIRSFTDKDNGLYQNALSRGHKLGVWANSDHISTHTSYGGVYVKEFTREGIIEGTERPPHDRRHRQDLRRVHLQRTPARHRSRGHGPAVARLEDRRHRRNLASDAGPQRRELPAVEAGDKDVRANVRRRISRRRRESLLSSRRASRRQHGMEFARLGSSELRAKMY